MFLCAESARPMCRDIRHAGQRQNGRPRIGSRMRRAVRRVRLGRVVLFNLRDAVEALQAPFLVEGFEDHMCDSDKSENFRRLYECTDRQRDGTAAWTRAECAAPDVLKPAQCAVLIEQFTPDSAHPACATPADGWNVAAIADYTCSLECAEALTTVWTQCQTSWWHFTDTWDQDGRDTLMAMVDQDPEFPGPALAPTQPGWTHRWLRCVTMRPVVRRHPMHARLWVSYPAPRGHPGLAVSAVANELRERHLRQGLAAPRAV